MSQKIRNLIFLSVSVAGVLVFVGNGCSQGLVSNMNDSVQSITGGGSDNSSSGDSEIPIIPGTKTVSLVYSKQVLEHLSSCAGVINPSERSIAMYEQKKGAISTYGTVNTVTAPMMMAISSIAGEVCQDAIEQEISSGQRLFIGFDLTAATPASSAVLSNAIRRLALSCWQRQENAFESQTLTDMITSSVNSEPMAQKKSALMLCTSMLSGIDSLLN